MTRHDAADLRRQLAALIVKGDVRAHQREIAALVQAIHDRTHRNPAKILETACEDAGNLLLRGDAP